MWPLPSPNDALAFVVETGGGKSQDFGIGIFKMQSVCVCVGVAHNR